MKKIWVAGSRSIISYSDVADVLKVFISEFDVVRTGRARGVDDSAMRWCIMNDIKREPSINPDWKRFGKGAGLIRNVEGVTWADECIVIWDGKSRGSKHVIDECGRQNKLCRVILPGTIQGGFKTKRIEL